MSRQEPDLGIFSNEPDFGKVLYHVSGRILLDPIASPTSSGDTYLIFDSRTTFIKVKFVCYRDAEFDALALATDVLVSVKGVFEDSVESSKTPAPCVKRIRAC